MASSAVAHVVLLAALFAPQDPAPATQKPTSRPAVPAEASAPKAAPVRELAKAEAKKLAKDTKKALRKKGANLGERLRALEPLTQARHKALVPILADAVHRDPAITVAKTAATALGHQPPAAARPAILRALDRCEKPAVTAALITSLSTAGYQGRADWDVLRKRFVRTYSEELVPVQRAILALARAHKEPRSWKLLIDHLDEPIPDDVHGASNPPAEYWEGRWKAWRATREEVKQALFELTGQRFSSRKEAHAWIKVHGKRRGLR